MPTLGFEEAAVHCAELGFDSIEVTVAEGWTTDVLRLPDDAADKWKRIAASADIEITSLTGKAPIVVAGSEWPESLLRLRKTFELAAELGNGSGAMPVSLLVYGGASLEPVSSARRWEEEHALISRRFAELTALAADIGARVAVEPHYNTVVCNVDRARQLVQSVDNPAFGIDLDISHFAIQGFDIDEVVKALAPFLLACEVKDQIGVLPNFQFLIPGEGNFDYASFIRSMSNVGYDGSIAIEISVHRQALSDYDPRDAASRSYAVLSRAFVEAGVRRPDRAKQHGALAK
jgi:sugar phosphate isomerase/epimerase